MKKILMIFICIFTLTSCFSSKNTENGENNSWSIISENSSQTDAENSQIEEKSEEKILPTEYEVIAEKTYFYTNSTDIEPRKAYVMKWDKIIVDNEKSTENMFFATYTNSSWKTTEWFLKKSEIKAVENNHQKLEEKDEELTEKTTKVKCVNIYDFAKIPFDELMKWTSAQPTWKVRITISWENKECIQQKSPVLVNDLFWELENFYKKSDASVINTYVERETGFGYNCNWPEEFTKSKTIKINGKEVALQGFKEYCEWEWTSYFVRTNIDNIIFSIKTTQSNIENDLKIIFETFEKSLKIEHLAFDDKNQKDFKNSKKSEEENIKKQEEERQDKYLKEISSVKWTSELLEKAKFANNAQSIKLYYNDRDYFYISTGMNEKWWAIDECNDPWSTGSECIVDRVANGFVFWKSKFSHTIDHSGGWKTGNWYYEYYYGETQYKTNIKTETTEKIKEWTKRECLDYDGLDTYPCE